MKHIIFMTLLGVIAGMTAGFWTRIIHKNMILRKVGKRLETLNNRYIIEHTYDSMWIKFIRCMFCITPYLVVLFEVFYVCVYQPWWMFAVIGTFGGLGAGNLVCETINAMRNEV